MEELTVISSTVHELQIFEDTWEFLYGYELRMVEIIVVCYIAYKPQMMEIIIKKCVNYKWSHITWCIAWIGSRYFQTYFMVHNREGWR